MPKPQTLRRQRCSPRHDGSVAQSDGERPYRRFSNHSQAHSGFLHGSLPPVVFIDVCAECTQLSPAEYVDALCMGLSQKDLMCGDFASIAPSGLPRTILCKACWAKSRAGGRTKEKS